MVLTRRNTNTMTKASVETAIEKLQKSIEKSKKKITRRSLKKTPPPSMKISDMFVKSKYLEPENESNVFDTPRSIRAELKKEGDKVQLKTKRNVKRPVALGIQKYHLKKLARTGGKTLLGEIINGDVRCRSCKRGDDEDSMLLCDKCNDGYHMGCLKPLLVSLPADDWFCPKCHVDLAEVFSAQKKKFKKNKKTLFDFFEIKRSVTIDTLIDNPKKKGSRKLFSKAKVNRNNFKLAPPSKDQKKRLAQLASIAAAAKAKNMIYMDSLYYPPTIMSPAANNALLDEDKVRPLSKANLNTFLKFKELNAQGFYPPIKVVSDDIEGFVVFADENIPRNSIITEYCGVVTRLEVAKSNDNDSIMDLVRASSEKNSLVIVPEKRGNYARFLSGVNNHNKKLAKKQNVQSIRFQIEGECRVALYAIRDIKEGEQLYYDYNALDKTGYPTENFV